MLFINRESSWGELYTKMGEAGDPVFTYAKLLTEGEVAESLEAAGFEVASSLGTLTTSPSSEEVGGDAVSPGPSAGVVALLARKRDSQLL